MQQGIAFLANLVGPDAGRTWEDLVERIGGPLTFRFLVQPAVASALALRAGIDDARNGRPAYFWALIADSQRRAELAKEGWKAIAGVFVLAIVLDVAYQIVVLRWIFLAEALAVGFLLAVFPYLLVRGPVNRVLRIFLRKGADRTGQLNEGVRPRE